MCKEDKNEITRKTYYVNGNTRTEKVSSLDDLTSIQKVYSEDGRLVEEIFYKDNNNRNYPMSSPVRIKYYDQEGNFSHEETGAEKLSKMFLKRSFVSQPESKIKTMARSNLSYRTGQEKSWPVLLCTSEQPLAPTSHPL